MTQADVVKQRNVTSQRDAGEQFEKFAFEHPAEAGKLILTSGRHHRPLRAITYLLARDGIFVEHVNKLAQGTDLLTVWYDDDAIEDWRYRLWTDVQVRRVFKTLHASGGLLSYAYNCAKNLYGLMQRHGAEKLAIVFEHDDFKTVYEQFVKCREQEGFDDIVLEKDQPDVVIKFRYYGDTLVSVLDKKWDE